MIEDPPLLTLRRNFPRPTAEQLAAFEGVQTGFVVDAMQGRGALDCAIKPIDTDQAAFHGVAVTSDNGPADNLAVFCSLDVAQPGDVLVAATDGFLATAVSGDLLLGMARNKGVVGFVTDGCVRDVVGICDVGMPCFSAGVTPNSPARNGPGSVGQPVVVGGVAVGSGDIVIGDIDGVVVVPYAMVDDVIAALAGIRAAEADLDAKVKAGLTTPPFIADLLSSGRIEEIS
jgi:4-hydroxy-4-methyl-2-oxoglutarate aldolase